MEIRHEFPTGIVAMDQISLDLSKVDAEVALKAIAIAKRDAEQVWRDFTAELRDAEQIIRNTGSIFGNRARVPLDASGSDSLCFRCVGAKRVALHVNEDGQLVHCDCPDCGGAGISGPMIG